MQLANDDDKRFTWPVYAVTLRARFRCPSCVLVVTSDERVARWAAQAIELGGHNRFTPLVLGPRGVPRIDDEAVARADPELAVLSAMAHGHDPDPQRALPIALAALAAAAGLDAERAALYVDLVFASLGAAARKALQAMDRAKYEFQSEFAKQYFAQGKAEGEARGRAELVLKQLGLKFGVLPDAVTERVRSASSTELDSFAERVLSAHSLDEVLG